MAFQVPLTVAKALDKIHRHDYVIPAIQREFVWSQAQICNLFDSLLRKYPIGTFLFWQVPAADTKGYTFYDVMRNFHELRNRHSQKISIPEGRDVTAILDGQQRMTSLNIGLHGSYSVKRPGARTTSSDAYPLRLLHLDLCHQPNPDDELGVQYMFRFLTTAEAQADSEAKHHWVPASMGLQLTSAPQLFQYIQAAGLADHPTAFLTLNALFEALTLHPSISYFELEDQRLDEVLDIFIRVNSGGTVLSKSDLLLSVATAEFRNRDARDAIHGLVDDLNAIGQGFSFSKDLVLKAGLLLTDRTDVRFTAVSFTADNMQQLDEAWDSIDQALRVSVRLLASFGLSAKNMTANSVLLPVADYVHQRKFTDSFVTAVAHRDDREVIRAWVIRSLVKGGIWGSGLDTTLVRIRRALRQFGSTGFPRAEIEREMAVVGKSLNLGPAELEEIVDSEYKQKRTFLLLSLLYPGVDTRNEFHVDHVFPKGRFSDAKLRDAGVPADLVESYQDSFNRMANLQLLEGSINISKQQALPAVWAKSHLPDPVARAGYFAMHDLSDLPDDIDGFLSFFATRRALMYNRLAQLLSASPEALPAPSFAPPQGPPLVVGAVIEQAAAPKHTTGARPAAVAGRRTMHHRSLANIPDGAVEWRTRNATYRALVMDGEIVLEDGRRFDAPSAACEAAAGVIRNGWQMWTRDGKTLAELHP